MSIQNKSFSTILQELAKKHYNHHITFEEYRARRRSILLQIDEHFNGCVHYAASPPRDEVSQCDTTQPYPLGNTLAVSAEVFRQAEKKKY